MTVLTDSLPETRLSRCCGYAWTIKTKKICKNQWYTEEPNIHILSCGHALHELCYQTLLRVCRDVQKPFHCQECEPHWTRPRDMERRMKGEIGKSIVKYGTCLCSGGKEVVDLRLEQNADGKWDHGVWTSKNPSVELLSCGHIFHKQCWLSFMHILNEIKLEITCPFCKPPRLEISNLEQKLSESQEECWQLKIQLIRHKQEMSLKETANEQKNKAIELSKRKQRWMTVAKTFLVAFMALNILLSVADVDVSLSLINVNFEIQRFHLIIMSMLISAIQYRLFLR